MIFGGEKMNENTKKICNIVFRLVIFACFIMAVIMVVNMITFIMIMDKDDPKKTDEFVDAILAFTGLYQGVFYASCAAFILSILSKYKCSTAAIVVRTIFIGILTAVMAFGLKVDIAMHDVTEVLEKLKLTDLNKITKEKCIEAGITKERAEELAETLNADSAQGAVIAMSIAIFLSALIYFILTCTSLHNLLKKNKTAEEAQG